MRLSALLASLLFLTSCTTLTSGPQPGAADTDIDIPFQRHVLDNGLTVILHEDHKAPVVAVNVWYHVGSKDEKPGRTGFAHLFEHLMFQGSENYRDEYFKPFEKVGATSMNGTTWLDRTNYYQNVPTTALDLALWMESDRMGHFIGAVDEALLDEQRGVVKNEKRQRLNAPYGGAFQALQRASFPEGHPYRWETIGSMEDLDAASLEDVKEWFATKYGAANATLVLAGDIDPDEALAKVRTYFGDIPAGPPVARRKTWVAKREAPTRELMQDRVAQTRIMRSWNVAELGNSDLDQLQMAAQILGSGKTSRLYQRLAYHDQLVDSVGVYLLPFELSSLFIVYADVKTGVDSARVEQAMDEEMRRFLAKGPSREELSRVAIDLEAGFVRGIERVGGNGSKSDVLASNQVYLGDAGAWKSSLQAIRTATPNSVRAAASRWLETGDHTLLVSPFPTYTTVASDVDRSSGPPVVSEFPDLSFPTLERGRLSNGIEVILARRTQTPIVELQMIFDAGYVADVGGLQGTASMTMAMLDEGTPSRTALEIAEQTERLGAQMSSGSSLDSSSVSLSALKAKLAPSLDLFADVVRNPSFSDREYTRVQASWLAGIEQEKTQPAGMALRELPPLLYGKDHAYGMPFSGTGTLDSIRSLSTDQLRSFHRTWIRPDNATIVVAGDTTLTEISAELERVFGSWQAPDMALKSKSIPEVALPESPRIFLMNRSDAEQSVILGGHLTLSTTDPRNLLFETTNGVLGGTFTARINMNLREDKHWSYGARTFVPGAVGQRPMMVYAPVQTDKTAESLLEIIREMRDYVSTRPATEAEVANIKDQDIRSLPGQYETNGAVLGALSGIAVYQRPDNYVQTLKARIESQTVDQVNALARELIHADRMTWLIVGDLSKIEPQIRALKLAPVTVLTGAQ